MKTNSSCCGGTTTPCDSTISELPRYYPRQLITPDDLTLDRITFAIACAVTTGSTDGAWYAAPSSVR